jgi:site-specific DNA-cytosine methylase
MENQSLEENQESLNNLNKSHSSEMWLTPSATNIDTRSEEGLIKRKKYRESTGRKTTPPGNLAEQVQYGGPVKDMKIEILNLADSVKMWPTPSAGMWKQDVNDSGEYAQRVKDNGHQVMLPSAVKLEQSKTMWPTPTTKGYGHASEGQTLMLRKMVEEGVLTEIEAEQMMNGTTLRPPRMEKWKFPTPTARDYKDTGKEVVNSTRSLLPQKVAKNNKDEWINNGGSLSCNWVELLMGYPKGWTDMNNTDDSLKNVRVVWDENWEKDTPRVANKQDKRMHRLKGLGNAIVPQIAEMIGKAIMETE